MGVFTSLKNHFIIAMPNLADPYFHHCVIYVCEHSPQGAMGIIINFPLNLHLGEILENMAIASHDEKVNNMTILAGGPIQQERGFVLHTSGNKHWESSLELNEDITITTSKDILEAIASHKGPEQALLALGYAGWEAGQLERELAENSWLLSPVSPKILFELPPEERWKAAGELVGVKMDLLSHDIGHA